MPFTGFNGIGEAENIPVSVSSLTKDYSREMRLCSMGRFPKLGRHYLRDGTRKGIGSGDGLYDSPSE